MSEFPQPIDRLALVDLDGTLLDEEYRVADPSIYGVIGQAQNAGWRVGLSSDTPYEALAVWRERFGMNGPIIAERGAVVEGDGEPLVDAETAAGFRMARLALHHELANRNVPTWVGNPVEALRSGIQFGKPGQTVVLINWLRECSLGYFVRRVAPSGNLCIDSTATTRIVRDVQSTYPAFTDISEMVDETYGVVIVSRDQYTKRAGTLQLMSRLGLQQIAMVGNSKVDYLGDDGIALHYAVGDATAEYKEHADYVADTPVAAGVAEILLKLADITL